MAKKHIIITRLFEFGGSNSHLETLIKYFGKENVILILEDEDQLKYLKNIRNADGIKVKIKSNLHENAHLKYKFTTNVKELFYIVRSILNVQVLSIRYGFADLTINAVNPEKHLYFFWLPFVRVVYILHTMPTPKYTSFTTHTCNKQLGKKKKIITVSNSNKNLVCKNWNISSEKNRFVNVVYNCIIEYEANASIVIPKPEKQLILTMGHVIYYKNPFVWLDVAKSITKINDDVQFAWLGNGPLYNELKDSTNAVQNIIFAGAVENRVEWLKNSSIYYQPSLHETHGIAVIEAMYNHLPCVVSDAGGLPESVEEKYNGLLVNPNDVKQHIDALINLIDNEKLRKSYGENGYEKYCKMFTYDKFKANMDVIYA